MNHHLFFPKPVVPRSNSIHKKNNEIVVDPFGAAQRNGIMIGFQTDPVYEKWTGWPYIEFVFVPRFLMVFLGKIIRYHGRSLRVEAYYNSCISCINRVQEIRIVD